MSDEPYYQDEAQRQPAATAAAVAACPQKRTPDVIAMTDAPQSYRCTCCGDIGDANGCPSCGEWEDRDEFLREVAERLGRILDASYSMQPDLVAALIELHDDVIALLPGEGA